MSLIDNLLSDNPIVLNKAMKKAIRLFVEENDLLQNVEVEELEEEL